MGAVLTVEVYLLIRPLPDSCRPCWVVREDGATLLAVDPRATRREVVTWAVDHLTREERNAYRTAYEQPLVGDYLDDTWMQDLPMPPTPESLRLRASGLELAA